MRFYLYITVLICLVSACNKKTLSLKLTDHTEQKIVGEGFFTDSLQKHQFLFTLSNNLGSYDTTYAEDVTLIMHTPSGIQHFSRIGPGRYQSDLAFKGEYGANYTIEFNYAGVTHQVDTKMPQPVVINEIIYQVLDSINGFSAQGEISMNISSPVEQYMKFKIYKAYMNAFEDDTLWTEVPMPVHRIAKIQAGENQITKLPIQEFDGFYIYHNDLIKIEMAIISKDVGEYLLRLKNYVQSELINNHSYNAPYYYTNEAYGLGYGAIVDSAFHVY